MWTAIDARMLIDDLAAGLLIMFGRVDEIAVAKLIS